MASYEAPSGRKFFILVNHGGRQALSFMNPDGERIVEPQPLFRVTLNAAFPRKTEVRINGKQADAVWEDGYLRIPVIMNSVWKIIETGALQ